jgi:hypothetical protein
MSRYLVKHRDNFTFTFTSKEDTVLKNLNREGNINMALKEIRCQFIDWIELARMDHTFEVL